MTRFLIGLWLLLWLAGCGVGGQGSAPNIPSPERISLPVGAEWVWQGGELRLLEGEDIVVVERGRVRALAPGQARLFTTDGSTVEVVIPEPEGVEVAVEPSGDWWVGQRRTLHLWVITDGESYDLADQAQWSAEGGLILEDGGVLAQQLGQGRLVARWRGVDYSADFEVSPDPVVGWVLEGEGEGWTAGESRDFSLLQVHSNGGRTSPKTLDVSRLQLSGGVERLAVNGAILTLRAVAPGPAGLRWDGEPLAQWQIGPPAWVSLQVVRSDDGPEPAAVGEVICLSVRGVDALGREGDVSEVGWRWDPVYLQSSGNDCFRVVAEGETTVTATVGEQSVSLPLALMESRLEAVSVQLRNGVLLPGDVLDAVVTGRFSDGTRRELTEPSGWESEDARVVEVTSTGLVARGPGITRIRALHQGVSSDWTRVEVAEGLVIDPPTLTVEPGGEGRLTALAQYPDRQVPVSGAVGWQSGDSEVATVDGGVVFGVSVGSVSVDTVPPAQQPAQLDVAPRWRFQGSGPHLVSGTDFHADDKGNHLAVLGVEGLTPGALVTPQLAAVPLDAVQMIVGHYPADGSFCVNKADTGQVLGCSIPADADGRLVVTLVALDAFGTELRLLAGGFVDEGTPDQPVSLALGTPHDGMVSVGGFSHYRISLTGDRKYDLQVELVENGFVSNLSLVSANLSLVGAQGPACVQKLPISCTFQPDDPGLAQVDLVINSVIAPEGGASYRITITPSSQ